MAKETTIKKPDRSELAQLVKRANSRLATMRKKGFNKTEAIKSAEKSIEYLYKNIDMGGKTPDKFVVPTKAWSKKGVDVALKRAQLQRAVERFLNAPTSTVKGEKAARKERIKTFKDKFGLKRKLTEDEMNSVFEIFDFVRDDIGKYALSSSEILEGTMTGFTVNGDVVLQDIQHIKDLFSDIDKDFPEANINSWKPAVYRRYIEGMATGDIPEPDTLINNIFETALKRAQLQAKEADGIQQALNKYFGTIEDEEAEDGGIYD